MKIVKKPRTIRWYAATFITVALISLGISLLLTSQRVGFGNPAVPVIATPAQPVASAGMDKAQPYDACRSIVIWLDAGHGGADPGTSAIVDGVRVYEKDIALDIVLRTYELFQQSDIEAVIFLTRADDSFIQLSSRINAWNDTDYTIAKADLVVSVHVDFYEGRTAQNVSGIQVNFCQKVLVNTGRIDITRTQFAQILQNHLVDATGARDRRIRGNRGFRIPATSTMPAVLIEAGFMSNNEELANLLTEEYRMTIATAIYNGLVEALGFPRRYDN